MIIDFHAHIFPKDIRDNREKYWPGESAFKTMYGSPRSKLVSAEDLIETMDAEGIDKSVVFGFPWKNADTFRLQNDYIIDVVHTYPDRLIGMCCLDPMNPAAPAETERCLDAGLRGVGELGFYESDIDEAAIESLVPIMASCRSRDLALLIHTNEPVGHEYPGKSPNSLAQIYKMIKRFPDNKIVLAHWGGGIFIYNLLKKETKERFKNVWLDIAASPFLYDTDVYALAAKLMGPDKILLATDYPLLKPSRYIKEMKDADLPEDLTAAIMGGNAKKLLGI